MIETLTLLVGILGAYGVGRAQASDVKYVSKYDCGCGGDTWSIYVEETDDPAVYRGVYEKRGNEKYTATGRGVTNTLRSLANKIDTP